MYAVPKGRVNILAHVVVTLMLVFGWYAVRPSDGQAAVSMVQTVTSSSKETCQLEPKEGYTIVRSHYRKKLTVVQN